MKRLLHCLIGLYSFIFRKVFQLPWGRIHLFRFFALWVLLALGNYSLVSAQSFPVQVIPQAIPPVPIYFSSYSDASTSSSPLRVQVVLNDFTITNREVRLKAYFQGNGISFQSNDIVVGAPTLFLEGGIPLTLTNVELAPYFRFENITGISPNFYGRAIPEGAYQFCFEIIDVLSGNRLSQKSCATTIIFQNEPPFLVSPYNKTNIVERNPQNIVFQWTPRQLNVSNVEYELSIVEIWDTYVDPQAAFLSSPPIFQTTTTATTYVYGPSDPLFLSNKNYAWRVQAKARQGTEEIGLFKNQGYSEIYSFSYAGVCSLPSAINHEVKGSTNANIFWDDFSTDVPEYTVRYRKKGNDNEWFFNKTTSNTTTLWDLKAGTVYEYQVQKKCVVTQSDWGTVRQFTTFIADDEASVYECGITPDFSLDNTEPLPSISVGEQFTAGDFPIKILEVSGSNGRFTGKGYVTIPYLNSIRVGVEFTNVLINTDKQMAEGTVITIYDPTLANIVDVDAAIDTVTDAVEAIGEPFEGNNDLDEIRINWVLDPENDIKIEDGILIITNPQNGATETSPLGDDKVIIDGEGNVYHVDAGGNITEGGKIDPAGSVSTGNVTGVSQDGELKALTAKGIIVTFEDNGKYGYDQMPETNSEKLKKEYVTIPDADGNPYTLVHQAVAKGDVIKVRAKVEFTNSDYTIKDLIFKTKSGELIPWEEINGDPVFTLTGRYTLENETIYAVVPSKTEEEQQLTAGAFTLWHLTDRQVDVVLVAVDGVSIPQTTVDAVKDIFKKGVATLNLSTQSASLSKNLLGGDNELEIGDSPWLSSYNAEQKAVIEDLKSKIVYNSNAYYLFVFDSIVKTTKSIGGFMPLQRQFGFVFNGDLTAAEEGKDDLAITIAHELGHGVFALQHPFTDYGSAQGATDWLMDYKDDASLLPHMHWAQMHNPALKFYVFQDEEDGEIAGRIWFTPDWRPFKIEKSSIIRSKIESDRVKGTIPGFRLNNGVGYDARFKADGSFDGYYTEGKGNPYVLKLIPDIGNNSSVYLFESVPDDCAKTYLTNYGYVNSSKGNLNFSSTNSNLLPVDITTNCATDLCDLGQEYFNSYKDLPTVEGSEEDFLREVSKLICAEQSSEIVDSYKRLYEEWDNTPKTIDGNRKLEFSWKKYYQALALLTEWRENGISNILDNENLDKEELRDKLFEIALKVNTDVLALISLEQKVEMLSIMLDGRLFNILSMNHDALVAKVVASVTDDEAKRFLDELISPTHLNSEDEPLIYVLKEKLSDLINGEYPHTKFFREIKRLSDARVNLADLNIPQELYLSWDVQQQNYLLVSYVKNKNDFEFIYDEDTHTVSISTCISCCSKGRKNCSTKTDYLLPKGSSPFELVGLTVLNDVSPFGAGCVDGQSLSANEYCGSIQIVPALFLDYLKENEGNQRIKNFGWNAFNIIITVSTLGEGAAAITAIRSAKAGQKAYEVSKNLYTLLDFSYTVTDLGLKATEVDIPGAWTWVGYAFAAKGGFDLINKGGAKGIGYLRKLLNNRQTDEVIDIIKELEIAKNGTELSLEDVEDFVRRAELEIRSGKNPKIVSEYEKGLESITGSALEWSKTIGKNIDDLSEAPNGYRFYFKNGKKWISRKSVDNSNTPRLTVKNGVLIKYFHEGQVAYKSGWSKSKVMSYSKASRPSPETYLEANYITTHLAKFNDGASYLVPKRSLDLYGRNPVGRHDGQFVMSNKEMDNLLNEADGDLSVVENELGIPSGSWTGEELVRIDIPNTVSQNRRIPQGTEKGANDLWIPGGILPNGYSEIVIDAVPAGSYIESLTNLK
ncbi:fibronectin type III domain-containing protein [Sediminicola luteus]|uniref:Fibronectin type III domain-containing protein n=1 Tax=Sediminicola luteus TaxID=319238 RepID=A0ABV2TZ13_9FLAO